MCEMFCHTFALLYSQSNAILSPGFLSFAPFSGDYSVLLTSFSGYRKRLLNLVVASWSCLLVMKKLSAMGIEPIRKEEINYFE